MGSAPKWCAFLENLTEEMEESNSTSLYDDFKFVTATDLEKLNASHLIGTQALKSYMHGYFMTLSAYQKLKSASNPFAYEEFKADQIKRRMEKKVERIHVEKKKRFDNVKVNQDFVNELVAQSKKSKSSKAEAAVETLVTDNRFKSMFEDIEFKRDRQAAEFREVKKVSLTQPFLTDLHLSIGRQQTQ